jgi:hypothetical protein
MGGREGGIGTGMEDLYAQHTHSRKLHLPGACDSPNRLDGSAIGVRHTSVCGKDGDCDGDSGSGADREAAQNAGTMSVVVFE